MIDVKWNKDNAEFSEVTIDIVANNELGLLGSVSSVIRDLRINILNANFDTKENRSVAKLVLQVNNTNLLEQLLRKLKSIQGVLEVRRVS